jgi:hypothetical protein
MNSPEKVRRITIDERLADGLIRILIADLKANQKTFGDDPEYWGEEKEFLVHPEDYREKMGMPRVARKWPWRNLHEGQVFLSGGFCKVPEKGAGTTFVVDVERKGNFQCIDEVSKAHVKRKYMAVLEGGS